jgi:hypothetical protein
MDSYAKVSSFDLFPASPRSIGDPTGVHDQSKPGSILILNIIKNRILFNFFRMPFFCSFFL